MSGAIGSKRGRDRPRVGMFIAGGTYAYQADMIYAAHEECRRRDLDLACFAGGSLGWADPRSYCYRVPSPDALDAAILVPGTWGTPVQSESAQELIQRFSSLPHCLVGARMGDTPSVCVDNAGGVAQMVAHLVEEHGCRRIAHIAGCGPEGEERRAGYERALAAVGIDVDPGLVFAGDFAPESGHEAVAQLTRDGEPLCDAIFAANDWMATGALEALIARGVRVPEDVALVGFDDIDRASFLSPPLTTVRQPPAHLGIEAVRLIADLLAGTPRDRHLSVTTIPRIRRSCGCFGHASSLSATRPSSGGGQVSLEMLSRTLLGTLRGTEAPSGDGMGDDWRQELVITLMRDLEHGSEDGFLGKLATLVEATAHGGNVTSWYHVVSRLRESSIGLLAPDLGLLVHAETLFGRAYVSIGEHAERAQGQRLMAVEDVQRRLEDVAVDARTAMSWPALCEVLTMHLPRLNIPRCYVAMGRGGLGSQSRQMFAFEHGQHRPLPDEGVVFPTGEIVSPSVAPEERTSLVVYPLFVRDEIMGHCCLELGPRDGSIFKTLGDVASSAIKATQLSDALIAEVTRRERAEQERMVQELEIASRIQTAILPRDPSVPGLELATAMVPATEVGGDYFDVLPCPGGCWIGVGDVAGHGLQAGLVMLMIQGIVAATVNRREDLAPGEAWRRLNEILTHNIRHRMHRDEHATLSLIRYHESGRLCFAGGHEDLVVYRRATGRCEVIATPGVWAGVLEELEEDAYGERECQLGPGDVLLLYTDGVLEAANAAGEMYEMGRLTSLLERCGGDGVEQIRDAIVSDVMEFMSEQHDDVTLLVARHVGVG